MTPTIKNLTPHAITLRAADGAETTLAPAGAVPRVGNAPGAMVSDHPLAGVVAVFGPDRAGAVVGLPDPEPGVFLVVSGMVGDALRAAGLSRPDVLVPGTGPADGAVRNAAGHVVAVTRLKVATA